MPARGVGGRVLRKGVAFRGLQWTPGKDGPPSFASLLVADPGALVASLRLLDVSLSGRQHPVLHLCAYKGRTLPWT